MCVSVCVSNMEVGLLACVCDLVALARGRKRTCSV